MNLISEMAWPKEFQELIKQIEYERNIKKLIDMFYQHYEGETKHFAWSDNPPKTLGTDRDGIE